MFTGLFTVTNFLYFFSIALSVYNNVLNNKALKSREIKSLLELRDYTKIK